MSLVKWVGLHRYIWYHVRYSHCVAIHSAGEISDTLSIMSKTLQVSCHSYSGCDVISVVYVMLYTVGLYSGILWMWCHEYSLVMSVIVVVVSHRIHMISYI